MADKVTITIVGDTQAYKKALAEASLYERVIDLLNCGPEDEDVVAVFRGQLSVNDVRDRMGLAPDEWPCSDRRGLLDPYSYAMELGEALAATIVDRMVQSESQVERDFVHHCREERDSFLRKYCGVQC